MSLVIFVLVAHSSFKLNLRYNQQKALYLPYIISNAPISHPELAYIFKIFFVIRNQNKIIAKRYGSNQHIHIAYPSVFISYLKPYFTIACCAFTRKIQNAEIWDKIAHL